MRIATWNLWWSEIHRQDRLEATIEALEKLDADIVALQEVGMRADAAPDSTVVEYCMAHTGFQYGVIHEYGIGEEEGLGFLSKLPLRTTTPLPPEPNSEEVWSGLGVSVTYGDMSINLTNMHLDWQSVITREAQIVAATQWIDAATTGRAYNVLLGDFNSPPESSVYRYLSGQQSLIGTATTDWHDLPLIHARANATDALPTLDFLKNPRWATQPTLQLPARVDWILFRDLFADKLPYPRLTEAGLFGVEASPRAGLVPSDHYGVYVDLDFDTMEGMER